MTRRKINTGGRGIDELNWQRAIDAYNAGYRRGLVGGAKDGRWYLRPEFEKGYRAGVRDAA